MSIDSVRRSIRHRSRLLPHAAAFAADLLVATAAIAFVAAAVLFV
jgi:hypothetical protein